MYRWVNSFLYHRTAGAKFDGSLSKEVKLNEGVPQRTVLSPTLFLQYLNDVINALPPRVSYSLRDDDMAGRSTAEHTTAASFIVQDRHLGRRLAIFLFS